MAKQHQILLIIVNNYISYYYFLNKISIKKLIGFDDYFIINNSNLIV